MNKKISGFTLVELIVVITILAILGTIAFVSFQGYGQSARDSVRLADLKNISKSLDLYKLLSDVYPDPTGGVNVTFSGSDLWSQGTIGESVVQEVKKLTSVPLDPLTKTEYTYSRTYKKNEYQLGALFEGDLLTQNRVTPVANAGDSIGYAYITGQYNGSILDVSQGNTTYILAVPTLINGDMSVTDIQTIITNGQLVLKGTTNLPSSYSGTIYDVNAGGNIVSVHPDKLVVFSGALGDLTGTDSVVRKDFVLALQEAYMGTTTESIGSTTISQLINTSSTDDTAMESYAVTMLNSQLGTQLVAQTQGGLVTNPYSACTAQGEVLSATTTYGTCDTNDIIVCSGPGTGYAIAACNVGTSIAGTGASSYGDYIQFGKSDSSFTITTNNDWKSPGSSELDWGVSPGDWGSATYTSATPENQLKMQGVCEEGYHIPTRQDWTALENQGYYGYTWTDVMYDYDIVKMRNLLLLPIAGLKEPNGSVTIGSAGFYASSTPHWQTSGNRGFYFTFSDPNSVSSVSSLPRSYGFPVRCFKND